jgi:hypothetical protein
LLKYQNEMFIYFPEMLQPQRLMAGGLPLVRFSVRTMAQGGRNIDQEFSVENQSAYLREILRPETFEVLTTETAEINEWVSSRMTGTNKGKSRVTLLEKIMFYKHDYTEKTVLLCEKTADRIMQSVRVHSRADPAKTELVDCEGGLCLLAARAGDSFKSAIVLEKDRSLAPLEAQARATGLPASVRVENLSLARIAAMNIHQRGLYASPLVDLLPRDSFSEAVPSYTIVGSVTHAVIKYLTQRRLYRTSPLGEFYTTRPEFFFIVPARTYFHLCCGRGGLEPVTERCTEEEMRERIAAIEPVQSLMIPNNIAFQLLFDFCLVDVLPRQAFFPWKPYSAKGHTPSKAKMNLGIHYEGHAQDLMLVYARPKPDEAVGVRNPAHLAYFLGGLMKRRLVFLVATFEEWCPGSGLAVVMSGFTIFTLVSDLKPRDLLPLYHILTDSPGFDTSQFIVEAELWVESQNSVESDRRGPMEQAHRRDMENYRSQLKDAVRRGLVKEGGRVELP